MSDTVWIGGIYIKNEGGYEIILKSLMHYKNRLRTIGGSPELKDSGQMFVSLLHNEAAKTIPKIDEMITKVQDALSDDLVLASLKEDISFLVKAISCYESDIKKAQDTGHQYFLDLVGALPFIKNDLKIIKIALNKINQFSI